MFPTFASSYGSASALLNMTVIRDSSRLPRPGIQRPYFELVLRVVVEIRSSETSFGLPIASTSLPV